ncbi:putative Ca2+/H+ antiporter (TMEM165/GDT1 family) [Arthrobacter sp. UYNi723]
MSVFLLIPVVTLVLWLGHAGLAIAGSPAARYTRWVLFGGLPVVAAVMLLSGGMAGFILALITALTWLGTILLEVFLTVGLLVARDARVKKAI